MAGILKSETPSRSLWIQTDTKLNDTTTRTAFILSKSSVCYLMPFICVRLAAIKIVILIELVHMRRWCCVWLLRCVSESRATVTVAAAVAGLQAGSFLDSCISLTLSHLTRIVIFQKNSDPLFSTITTFENSYIITSEIFSHFIYSLFHTG